MTSAETAKTLESFNTLKDTEDYLKFFNIEYDEKFVNINRLHILKQFSLLIKEIDATFPDATETEKLEKYGSAFEEAYELFKEQKPVDTRLFKVFKDKPKNFVALEDVTT